MERYLIGNEIAPWKIGGDTEVLDVHLLYHFMKMDLSFPCIKELFPEHPDTVLRNLLRKLISIKGWVSPLKFNSNQRGVQKIYTLTSEGRNVISSLLDCDPPARDSPTFYLASHYLGVGGVYRSCFYKTTDISLEKEVPLQISDVDLLRADAVIKLEMNELSEQFFIEHDCGTERIPRVNSKLLKYGLYGIDNPCNMIFTTALEPINSTLNQIAGVKELNDEIKCIRKFNQIQKKVLMNNDEIKKAIHNLDSLNSVRHLEISKNIDFLVEFFSRYENVDPQVELKILGDKKREITKEALLASEKNRVRRRVNKIQDSILNMGDRIELEQDIADRFAEANALDYINAHYERESNSFTAPGLNLLESEIFIGHLPDMQEYFSNRAKEIIEKTFFKFEYGGETIDFNDFAFEPVIVYGEDKKMVKRVNCGVKGNSAFILLELEHSVSDIAKLGFLNLAITHDYDSLIVVIRDKSGIDFKVLE